MAWALASDDEAEALDELEEASDRAAAIVAATLIESAVEFRLRLALLDGPKRRGATVADDMFRSSGPLGSFSAKINLGVIVGMFSEEAYRNLDRIREIRNRFAHEASVTSFTSSKVVDLCRQLREFELRIVTAPADGDSNKEETVLTQADFDIQHSAPRRRYMLAVRGYLLMMRTRVFIPVAKSSMFGEPIA